MNPPVFFVSDTGHPVSEISVSYYVGGVTSPSWCFWIVPGTWAYL